MGTGLPQGHVSPDSETKASLTAVQPARRVHHGLGPESRVCPPPASPSQGPAPPSRHITFSWPAHCVSSTINVMETAHWSPSRWCQHTLGVLPTLLQGRRTLLTWPPATARRPQAGSQHCSQAPLPSQHTLLSALSSEEHATCCVCTRAHGCSPSPVNAQFFLVSPSSQSW